MTYTYTAEYTDTFGGEANYSWVKRVEFEAPEAASQAAIMRRAKAAVGLSGAKGRTTNAGDIIAFKPWGACTVLFVY